MLSSDDHPKYKKIYTNISSVIDVRGVNYLKTITDIIKVKEGKISSVKS